MSKYLPFDKFLLRTPMLPHSDLQILENIVVNEPLQFPLDLQNTIFEAILIASPDLFKSIMTPNQKLDDRTKISLFKYLNRMSVRSTPFGLFSGLSLGIYSKSTQLILNNKQTFKKYARIDSAVLTHIYQELLDDKAFNTNEKYKLNETVYPVGKTVRLTKRTRKSTNYDYELFSITKSEPISLVIKHFAKFGPTSFTELVQKLASFGSSEDISIFLHDLINEDLLVYENHIRVTHSEILEQLIDIIDENINTPAHIRTSIYQLKNLIDKINLDTPGDSIQELKDIDDLIRTNFKHAEYKYSVQIDLLSKGENLQLENRFPTDVLDAIEFLKTLYASTNLPGINEFKRAFYARYENREIPLGEALDVEIGIGFPIPNRHRDDNLLLQGIKFNKSTENQIGGLSIIDSILINEYYQSILAMKDQIKLEDIDFGTLNKTGVRFGDTFFAQVELLSTEENQINLHLLHSGGSSAANLLTRFGYLDKSINDLLKEIADFEEDFNKSAIIAEIVHLAQPRVANIILRPSIRKFEIPYCSNSSVPFECQIPISDILVSVKNGKEIILRSKRLKKRIIPKLTTAHNFQMNNIPLYQFLGALQYQSSDVSINFRWPKVLESKPYIPRAVYRNVVLAPRTWNIGLTDLKLQSFEDFKVSFREFFVKYSMPDEFFLGDKDSKLLIRVDSEISMRIMYQETKRYEKITCRECLFNKEDSAVVNSVNAKFFNEIIFLYRRKKVDED